MIKEHDCAVLTRDLAAEGMRAGDIGAVLHVHGEGSGYEVEFVTLGGETVSVITLLPDQIRQMARREIAHARATGGLTSCGRPMGVKFNPRLS
jgi:hypothetical protein